MDNFKIIVATGNKGKANEINDLFGEKFNVMTMKEVGIDADIIEDGKTFEDNALIKVRTIRPLIPDDAHTIILSDDSGLCVDALKGGPGIFSARYAGEEATFEDNNNKLLKAMKDIPLPQRTAQFVSCIALIFPDGEEWTCRGTVRGRIALKEIGNNGFGYDPLFIEDKTGLTYAQLNINEKDNISHRAIALKKAYRKIKTKYNI
ncbi:RdgB/HAM1 family non-canonical purine NTP pyrophosphatase [Pseudoramibacter sp.]|jgi:XTP/dITP diphosphohydrolase|uniref:RdgB/HAM1 family non-canonical purine NTP pyrophosphatase n=1 Tax=Pseudoramibacter sp. TaxID=2034862 RepID=UPI0025EFC3B5|nr:RdgB/HAM1 family non-canonical purine NTP pyrophosphatase [Pseudoramibacter sp.]MCH4072843.1 RdgB/HAM1 family non-canonical purine NTP pyrophosphatase [Pseudoramibacter sp.]MCH4106614.1 RdgB/HAM1 family non-canonical purine NTP pyrophosphatase [Pseudoramibacter sp.]